jgi:hypothetical protein
MKIKIKLIRKKSNYLCLNQKLTQFQTPRTAHFNSNPLNFNNLNFLPNNYLSKNNKITLMKNKILILISLFLLLMNINIDKKYFHNDFYYFL